MSESLNISQYTDFFNQLFEDGRIRLEKPNEPSDDELGACWKLALAFEKSYRLELPFDPPSLSPTAFGWAATNFYRAAQFVIYRDVSEEDIHQALAVSFPSTKDSRAHYSVDLVFRFLPDLRGFAKSSAEDDPVCAWIDRWCVDWPLSSIGVNLDSPRIHSEDEESTGVGEGIAWSTQLQQSIDQLLESSLNENRCLMRLYTDRVLAKSDRSRLNHEQIVESVRASIGNYPELAGELRDVLASL